ncbi:MAG: hypothetical protein PHI70_04905 [Proteiniphilum sp.]|nr:hypothetical protein [Proteiniphilum sp.]MDD3909822.1 hypothetical protein [Proteiniphilum sp.]MDD4416102.1 hypothetical protein [Proteiniphilum sp.]
MRKIIFVMMFSLLLGACGGDRKSKPEGETTMKELAGDAPKKRYPLAQGIIHSTSETMGVEVNTVTYFDKWGDWEAIETTVPMEIMGEDYSSHTLEIIKGDEHWRIDLDQGTGEHYVMTRSVNPMGVDIEGMSAELSGKMNIEKLGDVDYLGYKCQKMRIKSDKGTEMEYIMFGNVMMSMEGEAMGVKSNTRVISVEEVAPPAEKFEIPGDIKIME